DRLVRDVLNTARIESGDLALHPEPISVLPVIQQVVEQTRPRTADRLIHLPTKPGLPLVLADRDRVAEVLTNLLDNADKYSPRGTDILIEVQADQTEVTLAVRDSGYGLGLYVCRQLIEAQGGRIWAENAPGGGAVFSFTLPVAS
ncbi:MAG: histidine kinase, partial [Anaerolineales bacterium]|nr:histidine kinase [Anaerolineales bacterium]